MEKNKSKLTLEAEIYFDVVKMGRDKRRWDRRVKCGMKYKWKRDPIWSASWRLQDSSREVWTGKRCTLTPGVPGCFALDTLHSKVRNSSSVPGKVVMIEDLHPLKKYSLAQKKKKKRNYLARRKLSWLVEEWNEKERRVVCNKVSGTTDSLNTKLSIEGKGRCTKLLKKCAKEEILLCRAL